MSLADDLEVLAFKDVVDKSPEYRLRYLYRWYSKTFATPLHLVPDLPLLDLLQAFWESRFEQMSPEDLEEERLRLIETAEERRIREQHEEAEVAATEALAAKLAAETPAKKLAEVQVHAPKPVAMRERIPETALPSCEPTPIRAGGELPQNVSIKFAPSDFFDELVDKLDGVVPEDSGAQSSLKSR